MQESIYKYSNVTFFSQLLDLHYNLHLHLFPLIFVINVFVFDIHGPGPQMLTKLC